MHKEAFEQIYSKLSHKLKDFGLKCNTMEHTEYDLNDPNSTIVMTVIYLYAMDQFYEGLNQACRDLRIKDEEGQEEDVKYFGAWAAALYQAINSEMEREDKIQPGRKFYDLVMKPPIL